MNIGNVYVIEIYVMTFTTCDIMAFQQNPDDSGGGLLPPDGGGGGGNSNTTTTTTMTTNLTITDSLLKARFPCAAKLIVDSLLKLPSYDSLVVGFLGVPKLAYKDSSMEWNIPSNNSQLFHYGETVTGIPTPASATINLNTSMLQNSSQLLIASVTIHETLHAVMRYDLVYAGYNLQNNDSSWMDDINSWIFLKGLPSNFSNHYEMMDYYFNQAVSILAQWDNNQHTRKDYEMAMLTGLNNPGANTGDPNYITEVQMLQTEYDNLKAKFSITENDLNTFKTANSIATQSVRLPTGGCN